MKKKSSNVYLDKISVNNFESATYIPLDGFKEIAVFIHEEVFLKNPNKYAYSLLDTGTGTGRTLLNLLNYFHQKEISVYADCYDVSELMLNKFRKNLEKLKHLEKSVNIIQHNADSGLDGFQKYDIALLVSVLQYMNDWRGYLIDLRNHLEDSSYLVIAELIGWFRLLDGKYCKNETIKKNKLDHLFWHEYFEVRKKYAEWNSEISFAKQKLVYDFLEKNGFKKISNKKFYWIVEINWTNVIKWIKTAPVSSLGSDLSFDNRNMLAEHMYTFLSNKGVNLVQTFEIVWGLEFFIFKKQRI